MRHTFFGWSVSPKHSVGTSTPGGSAGVEQGRAALDRDGVAVDLDVRHRHGSERLEPPQRRVDRVVRGLAEAADRRVAHASPDLVEERELTASVAALRQPHERLLLAHGADPARHALPAALVAEEARDAHEQRTEVDGVVEREDDARAERRADRLVRLRT